MRVCSNHISKGSARNHSQFPLHVEKVRRSRGCALNRLHWSHPELDHARKLLRDLRIWAESIGFSPAEDFEVVERLFGDVSPDSCDQTFQFGRDGKPFYVPGPSESPMQIRRRMEQIRARFGEQGVDLIGSP